MQSFRFYDPQSGREKMNKTVQAVGTLFHYRNFQITVVNLTIMIIVVACEHSFLRQTMGLLHWVPESFALFFLVRLAKEVEIPKKYLALGFVFSACLLTVNWFKVFLVLLFSSVPVPVTIAYFIFPYAYFGGIFAFAFLLSYGAEKKR